MAVGNRRSCRAVFETNQKTVTPAARVGAKSLQHVGFRPAAGWSSGCTSRAPMLRALLVAPLAVVAAADVASACPGDSKDVTTDEAPVATPCMTNVDFSAARRTFELRYALGAGATSRSGTGHIGSVFGSLELGYGLQFGGEEQAAYEVEVSGGMTAEQLAGDVSAAGLVTRLTGRLGPAEMTPATFDEGRGNIAWFPLTMEIAHVGEVSARPRMAARPEVARALYDRERVSISTRLVRVEGAGELPKDTAPGLTQPKKPTSWGIDAITLHSEVDVAMQNGTRVQTTVGGYMMSVVEHVSNMSVDFFGIEHQRIDLPMGEPTDLDVLWLLRVNGVNPATGAQYYVGWGEAIDMPDRDSLAAKIDPEQGSITIGGAGWYAQREWGGWGLQYKREPFVSMTGAAALEDRVSVEVFVPKLLNLVVSGFGAYTTRLVDDELAHATTGGIAVDASYTRKGFTSKIGMEVGRTFYSALDGALPEDAGFGASFGLSIQHAGSRTWMR